MKNTMEKQNTKELELARLFEVEELEERMEFGSWSADGSATVTPATGEVSGDLIVTGTFKFGK